MGLDVYRTMLAAVETQATKLGIKVASCIVDAGGHLIMFERMNGTQIASIAIAQGKAFTAVAWQRPSGELWPIAQPGAGGYGLNTIDSRFVLSPGGRPIVSAGNLVGAIGVSGGTGEQDDVCAEAGLAAFAEP